MSGTPITSLPAEQVIEALRDQVSQLVYEKAILQAQVTILTKREAS